MQIRPRTQTATPRREVRIPDAERPDFKRLAIIAGLGLAVGVAWPRVAGLNLVPEAPSANLPVAVAKPKAARATPKPTPLSKAKRVQVSTKATDRVVLQKTKVTSCRDAEGKKVSKCDEPELLPLVEERIKALVECKGAESARGTLSLGVDVDFEKGRIIDVSSGKSTTLGRAVADKLVRCAKAELRSASLKGIEHAQKDYSIYFFVDFLSPDEARARVAEADQGEGGESEEVREATGRATVSWHVALIRDEPDEGKVKARLLSGTRVFVTARKGDWYRVKYDAKGNEGWVFKAAIGL